MSASAAGPELLVSVSSSLTLDRAASICDAALTQGRSRGMLPLTVVVLDSGGHLVVVKREDGSGIMRFEIARGKAHAALAMGMPTRMIRNRLADRPTFMNALAAVSGGKFVPVPGGVLILNEKGDAAIGAIGVSGDTSDKDELCAILAIKEGGLVPWPREPAADWKDSTLGHDGDD